MSRSDTVTVAPGEWAGRISGLVGEGMTWLDFLTAIDRLDTIEVVVRLVDPASHLAALVVTVLPAGEPVLGSITGLLPGADWYERETAEMFGVRFTGRLDTRPLLTRSGDTRPPLLKSTPLPARLDADWPGADAEAIGASARRRARPPGVLETWESS